MPPGLMPGFPMMFGAPGSPLNMFDGMPGAEGGSQSGPGGGPMMPDAAVLMGMMMAMRAVGEAGLLPPPYAQMYEQAQQAMQRQQRQQQQQQQQQGSQQSDTQPVGQAGGQCQQQSEACASQQRGAPSPEVLPFPPFPPMQMPPASKPGAMPFMERQGSIGLEGQLEQPHLFDQLLMREQYQRSQRTSGEGNSGVEGGGVPPLPQHMWGSGEGLGRADSCGGRNGGPAGSSGMGSGLNLWGMGMDTKMPDDYMMRAAAMSEGGLSMSLSPGLESPSDSLPALSSSQPILSSMPLFAASAGMPPFNPLQPLPFMPPPMSSTGDSGTSRGMPPPFAFPPQIKSEPGMAASLPPFGYPPTLDTSAPLPSLLPTKGAPTTANTHTERDPPALIRAGSTGSWLGELMPPSPALAAPPPPLGTHAPTTQQAGEAQGGLPDCDTLLALGGNGAAGVGGSNSAPPLQLPPFTTAPPNAHTAAHTALPPHPPHPHLSGTTRGNHTTLGASPSSQMLSAFAGGHAQCTGAPHARAPHTHQPQQTDGGASGGRTSGGGSGVGNIAHTQGGGAMSAAASIDARRGGSSGFVGSNTPGSPPNPLLPPLGPTPPLTSAPHPTTLPHPTTAPTAPTDSLSQPPLGALPASQPPFFAPPSSQLPFPSFPPHPHPHPHHHHNQHHTHAKHAQPPPSPSANHAHATSAPIGTSGNSSATFTGFPPAAGLSHPGLSHAQQLSRYSSNATHASVCSAAGSGGGSGNNGTGSGYPHLPPQHAHTLPPHPSLPNPMLPSGSARQHAHARAHQPSPPPLQLPPALGGPSVQNIKPSPTPLQLPPALGGPHPFGTPGPSAGMFSSPPPPPMWWPPHMGMPPSFSSASQPLGSLPPLPPNVPGLLPPQTQPPQQQQQQQQQQQPLYASGRPSRGRSDGGSSHIGVAGNAGRVHKPQTTRAPRPTPVAQQSADALLDDKQLKRKQSNRDSARRSRLRKQAENAEVEKNMDLYMVQNKELAGRAAQLRATAAALEAANAAMNSFLAAVQAHRIANPASQQHQGASLPAMTHEVSALRGRLTTLESNRMQLVEREAANTRVAVNATRATIARNAHLAAVHAAATAGTSTAAPAGSSSHASSHEDAHDGQDAGQEACTQGDVSDANVGAAHVIDRPASPGRSKRPRRAGGAVGGYLKCGGGGDAGGSMSGLEGGVPLVDTNTASSREKLDG